KLIDLGANQSHAISQAEAVKARPRPSQKVSPLLTKAGLLELPKSGEVHDFKRQPLLNFEISANGKSMVVNDFNGDGLSDSFVGGGMGRSARIYFAQGSTQFGKPDSTAFVAAAQSEDTDVLSFDANGDGHPDLLVASGGMHHFNEGDQALRARLYLN